MSLKGHGHPSVEKVYMNSVIPNKNTIQSPFLFATYHITRLKLQYSKT